MITTVTGIDSNIYRFKLRYAYLSEYQGRTRSERKISEVEN